MYDIIIVGGGLVGASFALDLAKRQTQWKIGLIERNYPDFTQNNQGFDNKIYAIAPTNYNWLEQLTKNYDQTRIGTIQTMQVRGNNYASQINLDAMESNLTYLAKTVEYRNLLAGIYAELNQLDNLSIILASIKQLENLNDQVNLITDEQQLIQTKWLIAADGANSFVRNQAGFITNSIAYYQAGVVANFKCALNHQNIAHQWFFNDGILAYLPLPNQHISIVWSTNQPENLLNLNSQQLATQVAIASNYQLGELELVTSAQAFPLKLNLVEKFINNRIILIGDAAHTIHPLAGQGVNLGFGDAKALAQLFSHSGLNLEPAVLNRYNYQRYQQVRQMQITCHLLQRLFTNRNSIIDVVRNLGLNCVDKLPLIKQSLIKAAL
jgi:ubiquinone biosynthesis UbiH/UbiF/VisC/COQ6 family hydroxylase